MKGKVLITSAIVLFATLLLSASRAFAAEFYFATNDPIVANQPFVLTVALKADGQVLNAISGEVVFPADLLTVRSINEGNSMLNFWVEAPRVEKNKIIFSGIVPGGYFSEDGLLFSISFMPKKTGFGEVAFGQMSALLNDGLGTAAAAETTSWPFTVLAANPVASAPSVSLDIVQPESFTPEISQTPDIYDGAYFLVFTTQDKGSGIDHYEVKEIRGGGFIDFNPWINAASPYLLKDQELKSRIRVKVVDRSGNIRIAELAPSHPSAWYEISPQWGIIILITAIVIIFIAWRTIVHRKK